MEWQGCRWHWWSGGKADNSGDYRVDAHGVEIYLSVLVFVIVDVLVGSTPVFSPVPKPPHLNLAILSSTYFLCSTSLPLKTKEKIKLPA